ncbi:MAG: M20/M25/M40 family metallo-hydrolase [Bacteroidota bacterium]|nr:M20/M25/M40 family metallo-hydrolase [Candidatus Kapabacteria bacterium]MDW8220276.1 M20/M25/M40 family metallo-hydrolase [Bacteroidota bacterium]
MDTTLLRQHIRFLASDELKGRGASTPEEQRAAEYIAEQFRLLRLAPKGQNGTYLQRFPLVKRNDSVLDSTRTAINVLGFLDNKAQQTIILGAHYDHLGLGYDGGSLDPAPQGKIHNGADDNASGVAGMLELARHYATNTVQEPYNMLFIGFSAEELGLLGSKYFCEHPTIPLESVHCMINLDMIGRLNEKKELLVGGTGTSPVFEPLIESLAQSVGVGNLVVAKDSSGVGPSDHTSFYLKKIPILFFFTGVHSDYHKPSDDEEKINIQGEATVLQLVATLIDSIQRLPKLPFQQTRTRQQATHSYRVSLGIVPSYSYTGKGLRIDAVTQGRPAAKAGMQEGDIIINIDGKEITDIQAYMQVLSKLQPSQTIRVRVLRDTEPIDLIVMLQ